MFPQNRDVDFLREKSQQMRRSIIQMLAEAGSGHPGGSLSSADLLTTLYFAVLRHDPSQLKWPDRDRFVLSKGHCCPLLYAVLAETGYFDAAQLLTLRKIGSILQGHPSSRYTPGVEISSGSLGQGLSGAVGMALAGKLDKKDYRVYALVGDGEMDEGQIWEAAMAAAHYHLDNLCVMVDFNSLQIDGFIQEVMNSEPIPDKWRSFGWHVITIDGHDHRQILDALDGAARHKGTPTAIIAKCIKGKGVSFMENKVEWHGKAPSKEQAEQALAELR